MTEKELLDSYFSNRHILQSTAWGEFKTLMGTKAAISDKVQVTRHKLPLLPWNIGYAPKVRPEDLDLDHLYNFGKENNFTFIKLDVPHSDSGSVIHNSRFKIREGKSIFARATILMDLTKSDEELLMIMHEKTRYNFRLAQKKGVKIEVFSDPEKREAVEALEEFINLQKQTARRQKFFIHPDNYYRTCFKILAGKKMAHLVSAKVGSETAASWILFHYGDILYYPYGESNYNLRPFMASNLIMWESIKLGKTVGCKVFDLWGAASDPNNKADPWNGFTRFKLSFGGIHIKLPPTYDLIINKPFYDIFNLADALRWKILRTVNR